MDLDTIINELLTAWDPYRQISAPPAKPIKLWKNETRVIYIVEAWGPAVPYPAIDRQDGARSYGYERLKSNLEMISEVPEAQGWPELQNFLKIVNGPSSPIESLGCEKSYFPVEGRGSATVYLGSYVDVTFSKSPLNEEPINFLRLAATLMNSVEGCERWWGNVALGLERLRCFFGQTKAWGLMIRVTNDGRTEEEARRFWGESLRRMGEAISQLSLDFPDS